MGELSEDSDSSARVTSGVGGAGGSDQPDRPRLVALPEPESAGAVDPAAAASADADRLALERSLSGPPVPVPRITGAAMRPAAPRAAMRAAAPATDPAAASPAPVYATWAPRPHGIADAIALAATPELVPALRAELAMRAHAEAGLRARAVDAETRLAVRVLLSQRTVQALDQLRGEFEQLAGLLTDERVRRRAAEQRVAELERQLATDRDRVDDADREVAALRDSLQQLRAPAAGHERAAPGDGSPDDAPASAVTEVQADRLSDALTRLRAGTEPIGTAPAPAVPVASVALMPVTAGVTSAVRPATLAGPFRTLCRRDPALAGRLALSLLRMQRIADPQPVSYDIVLGSGYGCEQVTSDDVSIEVVRQAAPRPLAQVDLHVIGGPDRFAKLLAAGRIRRRLGFGLARVRGNRARLATLDALLSLPLDLPALVDGGMSTDPSILLSLVAAVVRPDWTRGARFSISHREDNAPATYLLIADGHGPTVTKVTPTGPVATVISCPQSELASVLTGSPALTPGSVQVAGDPAPLAQLQAWLKRAQSE
jgi:hypothetical protein